MSLSGVRFPVTNVLGLLRQTTPPPVGAQKTPPNTLEYLQAGGGPGPQLYSATGTVGSTTAISGAATVKRKATGATAGAVVTGLSGASTARHPTSGTVVATTGLNGTATARHPVTGLAGAVTTGTSGIATVERLAGTVAPNNVVTTLSGAATVTGAQTGNQATGQANAVTGLLGTANVTRAATGSVSSSTGIAGAAQTRFVVTGRFEVVTAIWDATVYASIGIVSPGQDCGLASPGQDRGLAPDGSARGLHQTNSSDRGLTSTGFRREGR